MRVAGWLGLSGLASVWCLAAMPSAGCGGTDDCTAGRQTSCACSDGSSGVQLCGDDGTFGECDCSGTGGTGGAPTTSSGGTGGTGGMMTGTGGTGGTGGMEPMCTPPEELCGMDCVNTQTSNAHCGDCDAPCPMGTTCQGGECACPGGQLLCDGECINQLTDAMNCGGCGHDCLTGTCSSGLCPAEQIATGLPEIFGLALGANDVYFVSSGLTNAAYTVPKDGSSAPTILASGQTFPRQIVLEGNTLYWTTNGVADNAEIVSYPLPNGPASTLLGSQPTGLWGLATANGFAYYLNQNEDTVRRESLSAPGNPLPLASLAARPWDVAVDTTHVYYTQYDSGDVRRVPVGGGQAPTNVASAQSNPLGIDIDATHVYWSSETAGTINRAPLAGGQVEVLASGQSSPTYVALDGENVYWTSFGNGTVNRVAKTGGDVLVLANGQNQPYDIAVDATHAYWTTLDGGTVVRVAK